MDAQQKKRHDSHAELDTLTREINKIALEALKLKIESIKTSLSNPRYILSDRDFELLRLSIGIKFSI